jgi:hypothetical protein
VPGVFNDRMICMYTQTKEVKRPFASDGIADQSLKSHQIQASLRDLMQSYLGIACILLAWLAVCNANHANFLAIPGRGEQRRPSLTNSIFRFRGGAGRFSSNTCIIYTATSICFLTSTGKGKKTKKGLTSADVEVPEASDVEGQEEITQSSQKVRVCT